MQRFLTIAAVMAGAVLVGVDRVEAQGHGRGGNGGYGRGAAPRSQPHVQPVRSAAHPGMRPSATSPNYPGAKKQWTGKAAKKPQPAAPKLTKYAHAFAHGHYFHRRPSNWGPRRWLGIYRCWGRWCPVTCSFYYWCGPQACYYPVSYCPTGSYDYEEPTFDDTDETSAE